MPTCLFTGDDLHADTRVEHTLPRSLGGRVRSQIVSSNRFNNATSMRFDDVLWQPYAPVFNYLGPLLSREHAQGPLQLDVRGVQHPLHPGGELGLRGMRVERRDAQGRPVAIVAEDPAVVNRFALEAGWGAYEETHEIANVVIEGTRRVPALTPAMEIAALKCALLTLDHVLAGDSERFTRSGWLSTTRTAIGRIVLNGDDPVDLLDRVSWGLQYEEIQALSDVRRHIAEPATPFEHLVVASGDPRTGAIDLVWLLAGVDPWAFRLTRLWDGPPFTVIAGCGVLRGTTVLPAAVLQDCVWWLGQRSERRSCHRANVGEERLRGMLPEVLGHRLQGYQRAVNLVERQCDDVVRDGILNLARFDDAEPLVASGNTSIRYGLERRLRRLFHLRLEQEEARHVFVQAINGVLTTLPEHVLDQRVARGNERGDGVDWGAWVACHRRILDALVNPLGLPGELRTLATHIAPQGG